MKSLSIFLVVISRQCLVMCFLLNTQQNHTERFRRDADDMNKIMFGPYNTRVESKCATSVFYEYLMSN